MLFKMQSRLSSPRDIVSIKDHIFKNRTALFELLGKKTKENFELKEMFLATIHT